MFYFMSVHIKVILDNTKKNFFKEEEDQHVQD